MRSVKVFLLLAIAIFGSAVRAQDSVVTTTGAAGTLGGLLSGMLGNLGGAGGKVGEAVKPIVTSMSDIGKEMAKTANQLSQHLDEVMNVYDTEYCTPANFVPSGKVPATFTGHSFALTFDSGSCYFNETAYHVDGLKELNCTEPSIVFRSNPAAFTSAHHTAPVFTSKFCQISKAFGEPSEKVIYVFDGSKAEVDMDMGSLASIISSEVEQLLGSLGQGMGSNLGGMFGRLQNQTSTGGAVTGVAAS